MSALTIVKSFLGLNNTVPQQNVPFDFETGQIQLAESVNVKFNKAGRPERRFGSGLLTGGEFHSLWSWKNQYCYVAETTDLYQVGTDLGLTGIRSGLSGDRISYVWTPLGIYYANGTDRGILKENASFTWNMGEKARQADPRYYTGPPARLKHLEFFSSCMFGSVDNVIWRSVSNQYDLYRRSMAWNQVPGAIRMLKAVAGGMYISDDKKTYFAQGNDPQEWTRRTVMEVPAMEWSVVPELVSPKLIGQEGDDGWACWVSADGLVFGSPAGNIIQPTEEMIEMPTGFQNGAAVIRGDNIIYNLHQ